MFILGSQLNSNVPLRLCLKMLVLRLIIHYLNISGKWFGGLFLHQCANNFF